jgi:hypothetical protein
MADFPHEHEGACECGAVQFTYRCRQSLEDISARACQCLYCEPRAATYLSDADAALQVRLRDSRYVYAHRFGTSTADFMHCAVCNVQVFVRCEIEGHTYALVSAPALREFSRLKVFVPMDYDGENLPERLLRRARLWIPELRIQAGDAD